MWKFVGPYHNGAAIISSKNSSTVSIPRSDRPGCGGPNVLCRPTEITAYPGRTITPRRRRCRDAALSASARTSDPSASNRASLDSSASPMRSSRKSRYFGITTMLFSFTSSPVSTRNGSEGARTSSVTPSPDVQRMPRRAISTGTACERAAIIASVYARPAYACPESKISRTGIASIMGRAAPK